MPIFNRYSVTRGLSFANSSHLGHVFTISLQNAIDILVDEKHEKSNLLGYIENGWVRIL